MRERIEAILAPARAAGLKVTVDKNKRYWAINVNGHAGAREDGLSLARELMQDAINHPHPKPAKPKRITPVQVGHMDEPSDLEIPRFLAPSPVESVPTDLQALAEPGEAVGTMKNRLWRLFLDLQSKIADNGKSLEPATAEEQALHSRLHGHLYWLAPNFEGEL